MYRRANLHHYQERAVLFIKEKIRCALFLFMGAGKSIIALTAITELFQEQKIKRVLVIAPLRVANSVWRQEAAQWEHTRRLKLSICTGSEKKRYTGLTCKAHIYVINRENVPWLVRLCGRSWPFDCIIIDESHSFKNRASQRFQALRQILPKTKYMVLLTGTPSPNGLLDLWPQMYLIDLGQRLGRTLTNYRDRFFSQNFNGFGYTIRKGSAEKIYSLISDKAVSMREEDYLELPERIDLVEYVDLNKRNGDKYREFEKHMFANYGGIEVQAVNAAVLAGKLLQWANGAIYTDEHGNWTQLHDDKLDALADLVEQNESENILVAYNYRSDYERLQKRFPHAVKLGTDNNIITQWNEGKLRMVLAHPGTAGMGLNLQRGGNLLIWFGLSWNLEHYQQFNARLHRQGQTKPVRIIHLVTRGTIDERVMKVIANKGYTQDMLVDALKEIKEPLL